MPTVLPASSALPLEPLLRQFLEWGYRSQDWIGLLCKSSRSDHVLQRVRPVGWLVSSKVRDWLAALDRDGWHLYLTVNTLKPRQASRRRSAVSAVRHLMLDADAKGRETAASITRRGLPAPSYLVHSSPDRLHILWRVRGFSCGQAELLQRHLARTLSTDVAATTCGHLTRLIGSRNHKYNPAPLVTLEPIGADTEYAPENFPEPPAPDAIVSAGPDTSAVRSPDLQARVRRYLAATPPAVAGQHGDLTTFRVCCRLVRGFALGDAEALTLLAPWNARCLPPWHQRELEAKLRHARQYGREPMGKLL